MPLPAFYLWFADSTSSPPHWFQEGQRLQAIHQSLFLFLNKQLDFISESPLKLGVWLCDQVLMAVMGAMSGSRFLRSSKILSMLFCQLSAVNEDKALGNSEATRYKETCVLRSLDGRESHANQGHHLPCVAKWAEVHVYYVRASHKSSQCHQMRLMIFYGKGALSVFLFRNSYLRRKWEVRRKVWPHRLEKKNRSFSELLLWGREACRSTGHGELGSRPLCSNVCFLMSNYAFLQLESIEILSSSIENGQHWGFL